MIVAIFQRGAKLEADGEYSSALKYYTKAAKLGDVSAHYNLSITMYQEGGMLRRMRKRKFIIQNRLPLVVIPMLGTILVLQSWKMEGSRGG
jgi:TPR repeat protein